MGKNIVQNKSQAPAKHAGDPRPSRGKQTQQARFIVILLLSCIALSQLVVKRSFTQKHQRIPQSAVMEIVWCF